MKKLSFEDEREIIKSVIITIIGLFLIVYSSAPFFYYFTAPIKSTSQATLVDSKLNDAVGEEGGLFGKKFVYTLKWEFMYDGTKYNCTTTDKSSASDLHPIGEKKMLFAYSHDGKNFKKVKLGVRTVGLPLIGLALIIFVIADLISYQRYKKELLEEEEAGEQSLYSIMSNSRR